MASFDFAIIGKVLVRVPPVNCVAFISVPQPTRGILFLCIIFIILTPITLTLILTLTLITFLFLPLVLFALEP